MGHLASVSPMLGLQAYTTVSGLFFSLKAKQSKTKQDTMGSGDCAQAFTLAREALYQVRYLPSMVSGELCRPQALIENELLECLHR